MNRREFLQTTGAAVGAILIPGRALPAPTRLDELEARMEWTLRHATEAIGGLGKAAEYAEWHLKSFIFMLERADMATFRAEFSEDSFTLNGFTLPWERFPFVRISTSSASETALYIVNHNEFWRTITKESST